MTLRIDRRSLLLTGTLGLGAYAVPGFARTANAGGGTGFTHAVASGEPAMDSMLLWTRYVPAGGGAVDLEAEISPSEDFARIVGGGQVRTGPWRDHTAKVVVGGLRSGTDYYYRFVAPDGTKSPVGMTKTLPGEGAQSFAAAIVSCSNLPFGYFNAYGDIAARRDIDCVVHLGDYFYEYAKAGYAPDGGAVGGRWPEPPGECIHLADYRLRYASYRADPDLRRLHQVKPMIAQWDDHESANDSWEGGAENHTPDKEGAWLARRGAAIQAYREWMPVSDAPWGAYEVGDLATLFRTETRLLGRTEQPDIAPLFKADDPAAALAKFRDGAWMNPAASMLGSEQERWLHEAMARSVKAGKKWQIAGFGTIMGDTKTPADAMDWLAPDTAKRARGYVKSGIIASKVGLPYNFDSWGGYPAARARFLKAAQAADAELVVISGDSHNGWAYDLAQDGRPAGVEFAGQSVTSPGFEQAIAIDPKTASADLVAANPELKWCDTSNRGYMAMTMTPDTVTNDWVFVDSVKTRTTKTRIGHSASVTRGRRVMA